MMQMGTRIIHILLIGALAVAPFAVACQTQTASQLRAHYEWTQLTEAAGFPKSYNFPVFVANGKMYAFHSAGIWASSDGVSWTKTPLDPIRTDAYSTQYVQFRDSVYALGNNRGNYERMTFGSMVRRTDDFQTWKTLANFTNLPRRIFPTFVVFRDKIWLMGGYDGSRFHNDIWTSPDGVTWTRIVEKAEWSPRASAGAIVFKDRLWLIGGGVIDGMRDPHMNSKREIWSSSDGIRWELETDEMTTRSGGTLVVFGDELWLVGANRDGVFGRSSLVTSDFKTWREEPAPWSPRGAVAAWVFDNKLFMTGGKYSVTEKGEIRFIYSNDVWVMSKRKGDMK
jgi:hypothetical protein